MSKEAEKIITAIAVVIGLICCVAVGAALFLGIGNEKQTAEYNEKYEFYEAVKYGNDKKVKEMLEANPVLVNLPLLCRSSRAGIILLSSMPARTAKIVISAAFVMMAASATISIGGQSMKM